MSKKYNRQMNLPLFWELSHIQLHVNIVFVSSIALGKNFMINFEYSFSFYLIETIWSDIAKPHAPHLGRESNMVKAWQYTCCDSQKAMA